MKISVIMPAYLGHYEGAAANRVEKFKRAIQSFLGNAWPGSELVIVSDGCELTKQTFQEAYFPELLEELQQAETPIRLIEIPKQPAFAGAVRNAGLDAAVGQVICYLDSDDLLMHGHLRAIYDAFIHNPEKEWEYKRWVYFNDFLAGPDGSIFRERNANLTYGGIGTGCFAHEASLNVRWPDGYGHDWGMVQRLMDACPVTRKIMGPRYLVCHLPPSIDY